MAVKHDRRKTSGFTNLLGSVLFLCPMALTSERARYLRRRRRGLAGYRSCVLRYGFDPHNRCLQVGREYPNAVKKLRAIKRRADALGLELHIDWRIGELYEEKRRALAIIAEERRAPLAGLTAQSAKPDPSSAAPRR